MQTPLRISFHGTTPTDAITTYVGARAAKLERFHDRLIGCHVVIEKPHRHKTHGDNHRVRVDLVVPGQELVVSRGGGGRKGGEDLYASIDAVFEAAQRVLSEHTRARRAS